MVACATAEQEILGSIAGLNKVIEFLHYEFLSNWIPVDGNRLAPCYMGLKTYLAKCGCTITPLPNPSRISGAMFH